jgi:subtilisin family serine protease
VVTRGLVSVDGNQLGLTDRADPERYPDIYGPLDGQMDPVAGHGTFIAGIIHQAAPDANIVALRVANALGVVDEGRLIEVLQQLAQLLDRWNEGDDDIGRPIDVLNLSLSYYHETPVDEQFDTVLFDVLTQLRSRGCVVVTSAGNDATARPAFPAALWPWPGAPATIPTDAFPKLISVGALDPGGHSTALFSNVGPWVRTFAVGASVVSTSPAFDTGLQATARHDYGTRRREAEDPDDYRGGFAVWSGTSFAAPLVAGRVAAVLTSGLMAGDRKAATTVPASVAAGDEAVAWFAASDASAHAGNG